MESKKPFTVLGIPLGGWATFIGLSALVGLLFGGPWWLFGAYLIVWIGICAVIGWIGGEWREKK